MSEQEKTGDDDFNEAEYEFDHEMTSDNEILTAFAPDSDEDEEEGEVETAAEEEEKEGDEAEEEEKSEEKEEESEEDDEGDEKAKEGADEEDEEGAAEITIDEDGVWNIPGDAKVKIKVSGEEQVKTVEDLITDAQKGLAADQKFQKASQQTKIAVDSVQKMALDPLNQAYKILCSKHDSTDAYEHIVKVASEFMGKHQQLLNLPPEERERRRTESVIAQKEREIEALKKQNQKEKDDSFQQYIASEITDQAIRAGIAPDAHELWQKKRDDIESIAKIYDRHAAAGKPVTVTQAVAEHLESSTSRREALLRDLPADELKKLGLQRVANDETSKVMGKRIVRSKKKASTKPAKSSKPKKKGPQKYYKRFPRAQR